MGDAVAFERCRVRALVLFVHLNPKVHASIRSFVRPGVENSLFKAVDAGEEELGNGDLALVVRRFPAVNDLTVRFASRLTTAYEVLAEVWRHTTAAAHFPWMDGPALLDSVVVSCTQGVVAFQHGVLEPPGLAALAKANYALQRQDAQKGVEG